MTENQRKWMSTTEVSYELGVAPKTVRRWLDSGYFPNAYQPANNARWRIPVSDVAEFRERRGGAAPQGR